MFALLRCLRKAYSCPRTEYMNSSLSWLVLVRVGDGIIVILLITVYPRPATGISQLTQSREVTCQTILSWYYEFVVIKASNHGVYVVSNQSKRLEWYHLTRIRGCQFWHLAIRPWTLSDAAVLCWYVLSPVFRLLTLFELKVLNGRDQGQWGLDWAQLRGYGLRVYVFWEYLNFMSGLKA